MRIQILLSGLLIFGGVPVADFAMDVDHPPCGDQVAPSAGLTSGLSLDPPGYVLLDAGGTDDSLLFGSEFDAALETSGVAPAWFQSRLTIPGQRSAEQRPLGTGLFPSVSGFRGGRTTSGLLGRSRFATSAADTPRITGLGPTFNIVPQTGDVAHANRASDLFRSSVSFPVPAQDRNPIYSDIRPRGQHAGDTEAGSSWWVPARADLDTVISKIDSRLVDEIRLVPGPYSTWNGPAFSHTEIELLRTPRYSRSETHGSSGFNYQSNGTQLSARQDFWGGGESFGFRAGVGQQVGRNYRAGNGAKIPARFESLDMNLMLGFDLTENSSIELTYLLVDQSNVSMPGQAFDIDSLVSNAFELEYAVTSHGLLDELAVELWTNDTKLTGNAQEPSKRKQFPFYDDIGFEAVTNAFARSSGFRIEGRRGDEDFDNLVAGVDLRHVQQQLNEFSSVPPMGIVSPGWQDDNAPIPDSRSVNPGVFAELTHPTRNGCLKIGGRFDFQNSDLLVNPINPDVLDRDNTQFTLADILGSEDVDRDYMLKSGWVTAEHKVTSDLELSVSAGTAQRSPTLTELYAAETFMFVLQNGLNTVTGDPLLKAPTIFQVDLGANYETDFLKFELRGYHSWVNDYITFENMTDISGRLGATPDQLNLKYVNTDLATIAGAEFKSEAFLTENVSLFGNASALDGRDRTRNGNAATEPANRFSLDPSMKTRGEPRGFFSGGAGSPAEPLPGMQPFQSRFGIRLHDAEEVHTWEFEFAARLSGRQDRVATSLRENVTAGFTVYDIKVYRRFDNGLLLTAGVDNLTDKSYREFLDFRATNGLSVLRPGISGYLAAQLTY